MAKICGVYTLVDVLTGKVYAGSSYDVENRIRRHRVDLENGNHHCKPFQESWDADTVFVADVLPTASREEAYFHEQSLISWFNENEPELLLNVGLSVSGGDNLTRNPNRDEIVEKMTTTLRERMKNLTPEQRAARSARVSGERNGMYGRTHSQESRERMSTSHMGNPGPVGVVRSQATRDKLSQIASQRVGELNPFHGRHHSDETKKRISDVKKARYAEEGELPPNTRKVMIDGVEYCSVTEAGRALNVATATIIHRIKSDNPKYAGYRYVT